MYQIFKDFAGPIATICTAIAAVGVTAYFAWHQKKIAKRQVDIAEEKLRHDLFEKRYRVFDAARKLLCEVTAHRSASDEDLRAFTIGIGDAVFLFNDDVCGYLEEMRQWRLQSTQRLRRTQEARRLP